MGNGGVREDIPFREVQEMVAGSSVNDLETLSVEIRIGVDQVFILTNVNKPYLLDKKILELLQAHVISVSRYHFIGGDFHCHSLVCDPFQLEDSWEGSLEQ